MDSPQLLFWRINIFLSSYFVCFNFVLPLSCQSSSVWACSWELLPVCYEDHTVCLWVVTRGCINSNTTLLVTVGRKGWVLLFFNCSLWMTSFIKDGVPVFLCLLSGSPALSDAHRISQLFPKTLHCESCFTLLFLYALAWWRLYAFTLPSFLYALSYFYNPS